MWAVRLLRAAAGAVDLDDEAARPSLGVGRTFAAKSTICDSVSLRNCVAWVSRGPAGPAAGLRTWLRQYAKNHPRRGFRPAYHTRAEGWSSVNRKKIQRLWRWSL